VLPSEDDGIDFEAEVGVLLGDTPMGVSADDALRHVRLLVLINDVSLRNLSPVEFKSGFGWIQAKPSTSFGPVAVTPDELGAAWNAGRVHRPLSIRLNGQPFGHPDAGAMKFSFADLIHHAARTRSLCAGTIIGSGTISNDAYAAVGSACIAERRAIETIEHGEPRTAYMKFGDRVEIDMARDDGTSLFGAIDQVVRRHQS
jgi:fumarylacetoacetate (FAA) hydrolase